MRWDWSDTKPLGNELEPELEALLLGDLIEEYHRLVSERSIKSRVKATIGQIDDAPGFGASSGRAKQWPEQEKRASGESDRRRSEGFGRRKSDRPIVSDEVAGGAVPESDGPVATLPIEPTEDHGTRAIRGMTDV
jgi:hypothetical protein